MFPSSEHEKAVIGNNTSLGPERLNSMETLIVVSVTVLVNPPLMRCTEHLLRDPAKKEERVGMLS